MSKSMEPSAVIRKQGYIDLTKAVGELIALGDFNCVELAYFDNKNQLHLRFSFAESPQTQRSSSVFKLAKGKVSTRISAQSFLKQMDKWSPTPFRNRAFHVHYVDDSTLAIDLRNERPMRKYKRRQKKSKVPGYIKRRAAKRRATRGSKVEGGFPTAIVWFREAAESGPYVSVTKSESVYIPAKTILQYKLKKYAYVELGHSPESEEVFLHFSKKPEAGGNSIKLGRTSPMQFFPRDFWKWLKGQAKVSPKDLRGYYFSPESISDGNGGIIMRLAPSEKKTDVPLSVLRER